MFSSAAELQYTGWGNRAAASQQAFFHCVTSLVVQILHLTTVYGVQSNMPHPWHKLTVHLRTPLLLHYHTVLITCLVHDTA